MTREELEAICRPRLDTLWPDIRIPGLPLFWAGACNEKVVYLSDSTYHVNMHLDLLASPIGADVLPRRVAVACGWRGHHPPRLRWMGDIWDLLGPGFEVFFSHDEEVIERRSIVPQRPGVFVTALAQLEPTNEERIDWGTLGSARLVDLAALALVAQHLTAEAE